MELFIGLVVAAVVYFVFFRKPKAEVASVSVTEVAAKAEVVATPAPAAKKKPTVKKATTQTAKKPAAKAPAKK